MVLECSVMVLSFFSVGLPHCFYIIYFKSFKRLLLAYGCFNNHNIYIYCLNTHLIMNVTYLKVTCGLRFHLFFFSVPPVSYLPLKQWVVQFDNEKCYLLNYVLLMCTPTTTLNLTLQ